MRHLAGSGMAILTALCVVAATIDFGAVTLDVAFPLYGLALLLALCWAAKLFFAKTVSWKQSPMHVPVAAFCLYAVIRYFTCPLDYDGRMEIFVVVLLALVYFSVTSNLHEPRDRSIFVWILMLLALAEAAYGLWQVGSKSDLILGSPRPEEYRGRAGGTFICPNHLAGFLELVLGLVVARAVFLQVQTRSMERNALHKLFVIYVALMAIVGIIGTASRAGWTSTFFGLLVLLLWGNWRSRLNWRQVAVVLVALGAMAVIVFNWEPARSRIAKSLVSEQGQRYIALKDPSLGGRQQLWAATGEIIRDHPVFGTGPGTWEWIHQLYKTPYDNAHSEYAHNDILHLAADYGLTGFLLVAAALACFFRHAWLSSRPDFPSEQRAFAIGSVISVAAIIFHSWFDFNLHVPSNALLFVTIMAFTVALDDPQGRFPRVELKKAARIALGGALLLLCGAGGWFIGGARLAIYYSDLGRAAKEALEWDDALTYYGMAVDWDAKFPEPYAKMGDIYRSKSQWLIDPARAGKRKELADEAVLFYDDALALNPYLFEVWLRRGRALELAGETNAALESYRRSTEVGPQNAFSWRTLGEFYRKLGDTNGAIIALERSFDLMSYEVNSGTRTNYLEVRYPDKFPIE